MSLTEIVRKVGTLDPELTIYVRHPWTPTSDAELAIEGSKGHQEAKAKGLRYFIEVEIARDFLQDWTEAQSSEPTDEMACIRLIGYATNDA